MPRTAPTYSVLRHLVHQVDEVDALHAVPVALVHGVDPQIARQAVRLRGPAHRDGDVRRPRLRPRRALGAVGARSAQVVDVRPGHARQPREARVPVHLERAAQYLAGRQPRHLAERLVDLRQQPDVGRCVPPLERPPAVARAQIHHGAGLGVPGDEPRQLRRRQCRHLDDVPPHTAAVRLAQTVVVERHQRPPHEVVRGLPVQGFAVHRRRSLDERLELLDRA